MRLYAFAIIAALMSVFFVSTAVSLPGSPGAMVWEAVTPHAAPPPTKFTALSGEQHSILWKTSAYVVSDPPARSTTFVTERVQTAYYFLLETRAAAPLRYPLLM